MGSGVQGVCCVCGRKMNFWVAIDRWTRKGTRYALTLGFCFNCDVHKPVESLEAVDREFKKLEELYGITPNIQR